MDFSELNLLTAEGWFMLWQFILNYQWKDVLFLVLTVVLILLVGVGANVLTKRYLLKWLVYIAGKTKNQLDDSLIKRKVFNRLSFLAPLLLIYWSSGVFLNDVPGFMLVLKRLSVALMIWVVTRTLSSALDVVQDVYNQFSIAYKRPIKSYIQLAKLFVYVVAFILMVTYLMGKSPWVFISSLGAMTAVLLLVFKDTILGFMAGIQLAMNQMVAIGDWIEMPGTGADGDVIDITLHTVKVQNWDKTVTTIPSYKMISESFKNWRQMKDSGGRRIKRSVLIDNQSVRFLQREDLEKYKKIKVLKNYLEEREEEIQKENESELEVDMTCDANGRRLTNIGSFRAYLRYYLENHKNIRKDMTLMVRQGQSEEKGIPLELYCFTNTTKWVEYEAIQSDIFDHLYAVIPYFGLRLFQAPSGLDIKQINA